MSKCYRQMNGGSVSQFSGVIACTNFTSDNGYTPCCFPGSYCLENSLCYTPNAAAGSTGFYEALCSDPTFKDPSCSKKCTAYSKGDAVFDSSSNTWKCCGADSSGNPNCNNPTNTNFTAPNPSALLLLATSTATSSSTSTLATSSTSTSTNSQTSSATLASSTSTATVPSASAIASSNTTSIGAIVGAVVGVVAGLLVLGALLFWVFSRRRRQRRTGASQPVMPTTYYDKVPSSFSEKVAPRDTPSTPLPAYAYPVELAGEANPHMTPHQHAAKTNVYEMGG